MTRNFCRHMRNIRHKEIRRRLFDAEIDVATNCVANISYLFVPSLLHSEPAPPSVLRLVTAIHWLWKKAAT